MCSNWGWGSLPQLLSWHRTTLIATRAKAPSIIHRGCEWLGWDIRNICHPTTEDYFLNIALLHPNLFLLKEEGDCGTKTSHLGEIPTPLRDRIFSSKSSKREGLTSLYASAQPQWTHVNSLNPELQAVPGRADFLLFLSLSHISFDQKFCLDQQSFSHGIPTKSFSFNEQAFITRRGKGLLLKNSWPIPIVSAATGTSLQNNI